VSVLVTGATGFVGGRVIDALLATGQAVRAAVRRPGAALPANVGEVAIGEIGPDTDWRAALAGIRTVIHLAAHVHRRGEPAARAAGAHSRVNHLGTAKLAAEARAAGVGRLVLVSTVKVLGPAPGRPFGDKDRPAPADAYARSKLAAEDALFARAGDGMAAVVLRPPLVYGPGVKANFAGLMRLAASRLPLPFAGLHNRRSLIFVDNLADALVLAASHPAAPGNRYLISDGPAVSTGDLIAALRAAQGRPPGLVRAPRTAVDLAARLPGLGGLVERLTGDLEVDDARFRADLGWRPPHSFAEAIARTVRAGQASR
jgi:UDP-glucose 4-epimerase